MYLYNLAWSCIHTCGPIGIPLRSATPKKYILSELIYIYIYE